MKKKFTSLEKFLIKWQTRSLGSKIDTLMLVLSVLVYIGRPHLQNQLDIAKDIIYKGVKPANLALKVLERIKIRVGEYTKDEKFYMQDRDKAFEAVVLDIQLYSVVFDMLKDKGYETQRDIIKSVIQKAYDETYTISKENKRILEYQEKAFK